MHEEDNLTTITTPTIDRIREANTASMISSRYATYASQMEPIRRSILDQMDAGIAAQMQQMVFPSTVGDYGRTLNFNMDYDADPDGPIDWFRQERPEIIICDFIEISSNINNSETPIQVMTGKTEIAKKNVKYFENIEYGAIKSHLSELVKNIMFPPYSLRVSSNKNRWECQKPDKAVDTLKELLDEVVADFVQNTFKLQKKLRNFKYIRG